MPIAAAISSIVVSRYPLRLNSRTDSVSSASYFDGSSPAGPLRCLSVADPLDRSGTSAAEMAAAISLSTTRMWAAGNFA